MHCKVQRNLNVIIYKIIYGFVFSFLSIKPNFTGILSCWIISKLYPDAGNFLLRIQIQSDWNLYLKEKRMPVLISQCILLLISVAEYILQELRYIVNYYSLVESNKRKKERERDRINEWINECIDKCKCIIMQYT